MIEHIPGEKVKVELAQVGPLQTHTICLPAEEGVGNFFYPVKDIVRLFPKKVNYTYFRNLLPKYLRYYAGSLWVAATTFTPLFDLYGHREEKE